jgi:hypothetical protein
MTDHPVDKSGIPGLLKKVRAIQDMPIAPDGRTGCEDCRLLDGLVENIAKSRRLR